MGGIRDQDKDSEMIKKGDRELPGRFNIDQKDIRDIQQSLISMDFKKWSFSDICRYP